VSSDYLLEVRDVSVKYGAMRALDHVIYLVRPGQMVCLLGGNASGKSTSMKAIFGMVPLATGEIYWQGERITRWPTERRVAAGLASVPEGRRMFARLTVEENLEVGATLRKDKTAVRRDLDEMYDLFPHLAERRKQLAGTLSGGEQQMVAIARALMSRPRLVCMDEPSMGLAPALVRQAFALIERIRDRGTSVFVVEQNANAALRIADYAYVLRSGRLVLEGAAAHVAQRQEMKEAYLGSDDQRVAPVEEPP
jgi:branched-chain amino acid transport system ATP-binding protein